MKKVAKITKIELQKRERQMLYAAIVLTIFAFHTYWYRAQTTRIATIENQIKGIENKELSDQRLLDELKNKSIIDNKSIVKDKVPETDMLGQPNNMAKLVEAVVKNTSGNDFHLQKITLESSNVQDKIRTSIFQVEIQSSFPLLAKMLDHLENSAQWLAIDTVDIVRIDRDLKQCQSTIKILTYEVLGDTP